MGVQFRRDFYLKPLLEEQGLDENAIHLFDLRYNRLYTMAELAQEMATHERGWLVWAAIKEKHVDGDIRVFARRNLKSHPATPYGSLVVYSWDGATPRPAPDAP